MSSEITQRQAETLEFLADNGRSTAKEIQEGLGIGSTSTVYDHISALNKAGYTIANVDGEYLYVDDADHTVANPVSRIPDSAARQTITKRANQSLSQMKEEIMDALRGTEPVQADGGLAYEAGNEDMVVPCHDDHFGEVVHDEWGEEIFNSEVAEERVNERFERVVRQKHGREAMGATIDTLHVPLIGDIVTNEAIYRSQPHHIDARVRDQVRQAAEVYLDNFKTLSDTFNSVQIICQHGNHGEFRVDGSSGQANADDLLYAMLDMLIREAQEYGRMENVTLSYTDRTDYMNFEMRGGNIKAHMRHGDNVTNHIGTSSPESDWQFWENQYDFDIAYRGHYHQLKEEPLPDGTPVLMGGSIKDPGDYEEELGVGGEPVNIIHGVTDDHAKTWEEPIYFT